MAASMARRMLAIVRDRGRKERGDPMRVRCFREIENAILEQHEEIRARLGALARSADPATPPWQAHALPALLLRFAAVFDAHLAFEERELVPRIRAIDAWGAVREDAILLEHREQRLRLEQVCALVEDASSMQDGSCVLRAVSELVARLLEDIVHEEHALSELGMLEDFGHVDQMTG
jgi:hypothetical protein